MSEEYMPNEEARRLLEQQMAGLDTRNKDELEYFYKWGDIYSLVMQDKPVRKIDVITLLIQRNALRK